MRLIVLPTESARPLCCVVILNPAWSHYLKILLLCIKCPTLLPLCSNAIHEFLVRYVLCIPLSTGVKVGGEITQKKLRQALPAFAEDYQLQEALARCEVILRAGEAAGIEQAPGATRFVGNELVFCWSFG